MSIRICGWLVALLVLACGLSKARTYDVRVDGTETGGETAGWALASGDMDGDGLVDLAISSPVVPGNYSGLVRVIRGDRMRVRQGTSLSNAATTNIQGLEGTWTGWALAFGNFEGDQYADLAVGQPYVSCDDSFCGAVQVVYGGKHLPNQIQLSEPPTGRVVRYVGARGDALGMTLGSCDVNGDGIDDLIIGAPQASTHTTDLAGSVYVLYGHTHPAWGATIRLDDLPPDLGFRIDGVIAYEGAGAAIACLRSPAGRDVLAIGSRMQGIAFIHTAVWLVHDLTTPDQGNLVLVPSQHVLEIDQDGDVFTNLGANLAAVDINGDGCDDLAIAAPWAGDDSNGKVYVLYGCTSIYSADTLGESQITGKVGFHVTGQPGDWLGDSAVASGNLNGDRFGDLVMGSIYSSSLTGPCQTSFGNGVAYVLRGGKTQKDNMQAASLDCITTKDPGVWSTFALALGDFDGNGLDDIASGAIYGGSSDFGAVYFCYSGPYNLFSNARAYVCNSTPSIDKPIF